MRARNDINSPAGHAVVQQVRPALLLHKGCPSLISHVHLHSNGTCSTRREENVAFKDTMKEQVDSFLQSETNTQRMPQIKHPAFSLLRQTLNASRTTSSSPKTGPLNRLRLCCTNSKVLRMPGCLMFCSKRASRMRRTLLSFLRSSAQQGVCWHGKRNQARCKNSAAQLKMHRELKCIHRKASEVASEASLPRQAREHSTHR